MTLVRSNSDEKLYQAELQNQRNIDALALVGNWVSKMHYKWSYVDLIDDVKHLSWCERVYWKWKAKRKRIQSRNLLIKLQNQIVKKIGILPRKHWLGYYKSKYQALWMKQSLHPSPTPMVVSSVKSPIPVNPVTSLEDWNACVDALCNFNDDDSIGRIKIEDF